jgi:peroxiredoxin
MIVAALCLPARAALDVGDTAPNFTVPAALGGKTFQYTLSEALAKGPVVLYFFPAAFSEGCSIEAHQFAPGGKVVYSYQSLNPNKHVERTLAALAQWAKESPRSGLR